MCAVCAMRVFLRVCEMVVWETPRLVAMFYFWSDLYVVGGQLTYFVCSVVSRFVAAAFLDLGVRVLRLVVALLNSVVSVSGASLYHKLVVCSRHAVFVALVAFFPSSSRLSQQRRLLRVKLM